MADKEKVRVSILHHDEHGHLLHASTVNAEYHSWGDGYNVSMTGVADLREGDTITIRPVRERPEVLVEAHGIGAGAAMTGDGHV